MLIIGLAVGIFLPAAASALAPFVAPMVVGLLFLAVLRIGPEGLRAGGRGAFGRTGVVVLLLQLALPLAAILALSAAGWLDTLPGLGLVLMLAAAPITGVPHITLMCGGDGAPALRQMIVGTALLPLTVVPVFWLIPAFGSPAEVAAAVLTLLGAIGFAGGLALLLRARGIVPATPRSFAVMEAVAAVALGVVVVGFMSAVGPALWSDPLGLAGLLAGVMAATFGVQALVWLAARRAGLSAEAVALGVSAGSRNLALFLGVLPAALVDDLLLIIGCYQIPMYLTPLVMRPLYRRAPLPA